MARPIPFDPPLRDVRAELLAKLDRAPAEHAAAMLSALELLQDLHDKGVLDLARGAVASGGKVIEVITEKVNSPASVNALRNLVSLANMLASIEPEALERLTGAVPKMVNALKPTEKPPGFWSLAKSLFSRDARRGLGGAASMLQTLGKSLNDSKEHP